HSPLRLLADRVGIVSKYLDQTETEARITPDGTRVAILRAMGIDASTPEAAEEALERMDGREWNRVLPPVRVVRQSDPESTRVALHAPEGAAAPAEWSLERTPESGEPFRRDGSSHPEWDGSISLGLRAPLPLGYHTLRVTVRTGEEERRGEQSLIVVPDACPTVRDVTGRERVFGVVANLYTLRSATNWGVGDLSDLGGLLAWTAGAGGEFVGVNPLHAL